MNSRIIAKMLNEKAEIVAYHVRIDDTDINPIYYPRQLKKLIEEGKVVPSNMTMDSTGKLLVTQSKDKVDNYLDERIVSKIFDGVSENLCEDADFAEKVAVKFEECISKDVIKRPHFLNKESLLNPLFYFSYKVFEDNENDRRSKKIPADFTIRLWIRKSDWMSDCMEVGLWGLDRFGDYLYSSPIHNLNLISFVPKDKICSTNTLDLIEKMTDIYKKMLFSYYKVSCSNGKVKCGK